MIRALLVAAVLYGSAFAKEPEKETANNVVSLLYLADDRPVMLQVDLRVSGVGYQKKWAATVKQVFGDCDANNDGVLTGKELDSIPDPGLLGELRSGSNVPTPVPVTSPAAVPKPEVDLDPKDGKVTLQEFRDYIASQANPISITGSTGTRRIVYAGQPDERDTGIKLFGLLDANDDNRLSVSELASALESLAKRDLNDDETLSLAELGTGAGAMPVLIAETGSSNTRMAVLLLDGKTSLRVIAARVIARYDKRGKRNRTLEPEEVGFSGAVFSAIDADENRRLSRLEIQNWLSGKMADVAITVDRSAGGRSNTAIDQASEALRKAIFGKKGGKASSVMEVTKTGEQFAKSVSVAGSTASIEYGTNEIKLSVDQSNRRQWSRIRDVSTGSPYGNLVRRYDRDQNGYLNRQEARNVAFLRNRFDQVDADGDGKLFPKEVTAYARPLLRFLQAAVRISIRDGGRDLFKLIDTNSDNRLTRRELLVASKKVKTWDRNRNATLDANEIKREVTIGIGSPSANPDGQFASAVLVGGQVTRHPRKGPRWFRGMDRNGDGDLTPREFLGPKSVFDRLDANRDGLISVAESARAK